MSIAIENRRYIGSKTKLLTEIERAVKDYLGTEPGRFVDLFAGTGTVAEHFFELGYDVVVNDILYANYVAYQAWMGQGRYDAKKVMSELKRLNKLEGAKLEENYFSKIYGGKYFAENDAKKIGYARDLLEEKRSELTEREYYMLLASLLYAADKIANTVGHFESYLRREPVEKGVELRNLKVHEGGKAKVEIFQEDANKLAEKVWGDVVYIDPPYNARQYINFYHVLENLASWQKPQEFEGDSMKFKRDHLKSGYSRAVAPKLMRDLVQKLKAKLIIVSYNNTYNARSGASNNKIQEEELLEILGEKGEVTVREIDYKEFNAGKTVFLGHKEKLYICEVEK